LTKRALPDHRDPHDMTAIVQQAMARTVNNRGQTTVFLCYAVSGPRAMTDDHAATPKSCSTGGVPLHLIQRGNNRQA
jgi:hypothetical protein